MCYIITVLQQNLFVFDEMTAESMEECYEWSPCISDLDRAEEQQKKKDDDDDNIIWMTLQFLWWYCHFMWTSKI